MMVTLSRESANAGVAGSAALQVPAAMLTATREWLGPVAAVLTFGLGAVMYCWVFYRLRLIPKWLSAWGLVAAVMVMLAGVLVLFGVAAPMSTTQVLLALPIAIQEMVLAIWLIAKGFAPVVVEAESADEVSRRPAGVSPVTVS